MKALSRAEMAWRAAQDIPDGAVVNLGIGMPVAIADHLPADRDVFFQSENGVIGVGPEAAPGEDDVNLVDAGSRRITLRSGACIVDSAASFAMIRGGHIDITVLGAFEVSAGGDLANWDSEAPNKGPVVGGAMDLAVGAGETWALMAYTTKDGGPRLRRQCKLPLTAARCVTRIYTDLAVVDVTESGFLVREIVDGLSESELKGLTDGPIELAADCQILKTPAL